MPGFQRLSKCFQNVRESSTVTAHELAAVSLWGTTLECSCRCFCCCCHSSWGCSPAFSSLLQPGSTAAPRTASTGMQPELQGSGMLQVPENELLLLWGNKGPYSHPLLKRMRTGAEFLPSFTTQLHRAPTAPLPPVPTYPKTLPRAQPCCSAGLVLQPTVLRLCRPCRALWSRPSRGQLRDWHPRARQTDPQPLHISDMDEGRGKAELSSCVSPVLPTQSWATSAPAAGARAHKEVGVPCGVLMAAVPCVQSFRDAAREPYLWEPAWQSWGL